MLIYFATYAISDSKNPQDSSFVALRGGNLYTRQVEKFKLKGRPLVVLSACQTGLGKELAGGIFGMALTWRFAGADAMVISLWNVDDEVAHDLMLNFMKRVTNNVPPPKSTGRGDASTTHYPTRLVGLGKFHYLWSAASLNLQGEMSSLFRSNTVQLAPFLSAHSATMSSCWW